MNRVRLTQNFDKLNFEIIKKARCCGAGPSFFYNYEAQCSGKSAGDYEERGVSIKFQKRAALNLLSSVRFCDIG